MNPTRKERRELCPASLLLFTTFAHYCERGVLLWLLWAIVVWV